MIKEVHLRGDYKLTKDPITQSYLVYGILNGVVYYSGISYSAALRVLCEIGYE